LFVSEIDKQRMIEAVFQMIYRSLFHKTWNFEKYFDYSVNSLIFLGNFFTIYSMYVFTNLLSLPNFLAKFYLLRNNEI